MGLGFVFVQMVWDTIKEGAFPFNNSNFNIKLNMKKQKKNLLSNVEEIKDSIKKNIVAYVREAMED